MAETWQPPRLRSGQTSKSDRHATWLELFFDLVFVVAVNALAHMLYPELSLQHLVRFGVLYIPVWWAWIGATFYATRFDTDDVLQRVLIFVQMNAVLTLALNIEEGLGATSTVFALAYAIVRGVLVLQYLRAGWSIAAARPLTRRFARGFACAAAMWLLSAFVPAPWRFVLWAVGLIVDIGTPLFAGRLHARFAPDLSHLPERFGLFTVVVLGESIVAVANGVAVQQWNVFSTLTAILGFSIAFCLWGAYFDHASDGAIRAARDHGRVMIYQLWLYTHLPLMIGLTAAAAGVQHALASPPGEPLGNAQRWLLAGAVAVCLVALAGIHSANASITSAAERTRTQVRAAYRSVGGLGLCLVGVFGRGLRPVEVVACIAAVCIAQIFLDLFVRSSGAAAEGVIGQPFIEVPSD